MRSLFCLLVFFLGVAVMVATAPATESNKRGAIAGLSRELSVTAYTASSSTITAYDGGTAHGLIGKRTYIFSVPYDGSTIVVACRLQTSSKGIYIDLVPAASVSSLSAALTGMTLTTSGHPSTAKDASDDAAVTAAGG